MSIWACKNAVRHHPDADADGSAARVADRDDWMTMKNFTRMFTALLLIAPLSGCDGDDGGSETDDNSDSNCQTSASVGTRANSGAGCT